MKKHGLTIVELLVVIFIVFVLAFLLIPFMAHDNHGEPQKIHCAHNLKQLAVAMNIYQTCYGDNVWFAQPASVFYGDTWLLSIYWNDIMKEPKLFVCYATSDDSAKITRLVRKDYAASIPADAVSYAGRCRGLTTTPWRNTNDFSKDALSANSMMACDDNQGKDNHADGINAVFFDSHAKFFANTEKTTAYSQVGLPRTTWANGELEKMDSGGGK